MSATFETDMFAKYFATKISGRLELAPVVAVEGRSFTVTEFYLDDIRDIGEVGSVWSKSCLRGENDMSMCLSSVNPWTWRILDWVMTPWNWLAGWSKTLTELRDRTQSKKDFSCFFLCLFVQLKEMYLLSVGLPDCFKDLPLLLPVYLPSLLLAHAPPHMSNSQQSSFFSPGMVRGTLFVGQYWSFSLGCPRSWNWGSPDSWQSSSLSWGMQKDIFSDLFLNFR